MKDTHGFYRSSNSQQLDTKSKLLLLCIRIEKILNISPCKKINYSKDMHFFEVHIQVRD